MVERALLTVMMFVGILIAVNFGPELLNAANDFSGGRVEMAQEVLPPSEVEPVPLKEIEGYRDMGIDSFEKISEALGDL